MKVGNCPTSKEWPEKIRALFSDKVVDIIIVIMVHTILCGYSGPCREENRVLIMRIGIKVALVPHFGQRLRTSLILVVVTLGQIVKM